MIAKNALAILLLLTPLKQEVTGKVIYVVDGDTIEVLHRGQRIRVHLNGIDCPESGQSFGVAAAEEASRLCLGKTVVVYIRGEDEYGRTLGDVQLPDGKILNRELVRVGLAWHYKQYSSDRVLSQLEAVSKEGRIGLWREKNPMPPWAYRHATAE